MNKPNFGEGPEATPAPTQTPDSRHQAAAVQGEMLDTLDGAYHEKVVDELEAFKEKTAEDITSLEQQVEEFCAQEEGQPDEAGASA